jgi:hypothetical protein
VFHRPNPNFHFRDSHSRGAAGELAQFLANELPDWQPRVEEQVLSGEARKADPLTIIALVLSIPPANPRFDCCTSDRSEEPDVNDGFFNGLLTLLCSVKHMNPVPRIECGDGGGIVVVECRVKLYSQRTNLLGYLWIDRVFLLGEGRQSKGDRPTY